MKIANGVIEATIEPMGAELSGLRRLDTGVEYLWDADKRYWAGHAPVLFPIVCAARNGEILVGGKLHKIGNHGFARKSPFELVESSRDRAVFRLASSEASLAMYPYRFVLTLTYTLSGGTVKTAFTVQNAGAEPMPFQLGTHAGFHCPLGGEGSFADWQLEFEQEEELTRLFMNGDNVLVPGQSEHVLTGRVLPLTHALFHRGALVFRGVRSSAIALRSKASTKAVVVRSDRMPYLGLWQPKDAPLVCIEPWHGIADPADRTVEFKDREGTLSLDPGARYETWYSIEAV